MKRECAAWREPAVKRGGDVKMRVRWGIVRGGKVEVISLAFPHGKLHTIKPKG